MTIPSLRLAVGAIGAVVLFAGNAMADIEATVPEPASAALLAVGGVGLYLLNRRRRK
jgi:lysozyme family protein